MVDPAVALQDVSKRYGPVAAVDGVPLEVGQEEVYALLGLNGAGKTTLMRILLGMVRPGAGSVTILGRDVRDRAVRSEVGYLVESASAHPELSVRENLEVARVATRIGILHRGGLVAEFGAAAVRAEALKLRRSRVPWATAGAMILAAGLLTAVLSAGYGPAASVGRGYLPAVGVLFVTVLAAQVVAAQVVAAVGPGAWFPWAVPAVLAGTAGPAQTVGWAGLAAVLFVGAGSAAGTALWWERADHSG